MELIDYHGVPVALVDPAEAVRADWRWLRGRAEVVRVERPARADWAALRAHGFVPKPQYVTWLAEVADSEEAYLSGVASGERQRVRVARRQLAEAGLRLSVRELDESLLTAFLVVYAESLARMRHGVAVACEERDLLLANRDSYFAVCVHEGDALVGCCLVRREPERDGVTVRFSAVDQPHREASLSRVLYLAAAQVARECGLRTFSLGKDRNLYGHIAQPGLLRFKRQLGLAPHPSQLIDPAVGYDQADLVLSLRSLADPSMLLGYLDTEPVAPGPPPVAPAAGGYPFRLEVFSERGSPDLRPFSAKFAGVRTHPLEGIPAPAG